MRLRRKSKVIVNFPWRRRGERRELKEGKRARVWRGKSTPAEVEREAAPFPRQ